MSDRIRWFGGEFQRALDAEHRRRLNLAAMVVEREAKRLLSVSGTGVFSGSGAVVRAVKRRRHTIYGAFPSRPGEPPRKQTGRLRASVTHEVMSSSVATARVGTNVRYGKHLQLGTRRMAPRPWLDVALANATAQVRRILTAAWNPGQ